MADIVSWKDKYERVHSALTKLKGHAEEAVVNVRTDAETIAAAGAVGFAKGMVEANGKEFAVKKIPGELILGAIGKLIAYSKVAGKATEDVHALANGPLAYLAGDRAYKAAKNRAATKAATTPPKAA